MSAPLPRSVGAAVLLAAFSSSAAVAQDKLAPYSGCGPVFPYRLVGDVCSRVAPGQPGNSKRIGDGFVLPSIGFGEACCVSKEFAIRHGALTADTREERCGELFANWHEAAGRGRKPDARRAYRNLKITCPRELARVAGAANVSLSGSPRVAEPQTGQMGGSLYRGFNNMSASELEGVASSRRRDTSSDLSVEDIISVGLQLGAVAATMYPVRRQYFDTGRVTPGQAAPRPLVQTLPRPGYRQSDISGTSR